METPIAYEWGALLPEAILAAFALFALLFASFARGRGGMLVRGICAFGIFLAVAVQISRMVCSAGETSFGGTLECGSAFSCFVMLCGLLTLLIESRAEKKSGEFCALVLICSASLAVFVRSQNLMLAFVALECATICLYVLTAWQRSSSASLEAAVRYLVVGGASGAIFLLGIAFLYGAGFSAGVDLLSVANLGLAPENPLMWAGIALVGAAAFFKMAAFPFQFWAPDVYQGAPTSVSAFLAVASKGAGAVFMVKICASLASAAQDNPALNEKIVMVVGAVAALTILVGNLGGVTQTNAKRLLAFSGISNAGYLLVLAAAVAQTGISVFAEATLAFYLLSYMFANYGIFCVLGGFAAERQSEVSLGDFRGMLAGDRRDALGLITNLASLAGIPPTAGFFGKVLIIILAWSAELYWLAAVLVAGSVVSIYYYFAWARAAAEPPEAGGADFAVSDLRASTLFALSACSLLLGAFVVVVRLL